MENLVALIAAFEQQIQEQEPAFQALYTALADCDPRLQLAIPVSSLPELTPPRRPRRPTLRPGFLAIRA